MTSPVASSSRSPSPQPLSSSLRVISPPLDPLGPLSDFIKSLQRKSSKDSAIISTLQKKLDQFERVQQAQQAEIDALKAERGASGKVEAGSGRGGEEAHAGRKRARSITDTLNQDSVHANPVSSSQSSRTDILAKLGALETSLLNEFRQSAAAAVQADEIECGCGYAAEEAADELSIKLDKIESSIKSVVQDKMAELEREMRTKLSEVESNVVMAVEDNAGGCECGGYDFSTDEVERKVGEMHAQLENDVIGVSGKVDALGEFLTAQFEAIKNAQADLAAKLSPPAGAAQLAAQPHPAHAALNPEEHGPGLPHVQLDGRLSSDHSPAPPRPVRSVPGASQFPAKTKVVPARAQPSQAKASTSRKSNSSSKRKEDEPRLKKAKKGGKDAEAFEDLAQFFGGSIMAGSAADSSLSMTESSDYSD